MGTYIIGLAAATAIVAYSILGAASNIGIYADPLSFIVVVGGTFCAMLITYPIYDVSTLLKLLVIAFRKEEDDASNIVGELVDIADKSRGNPDYFGKKLTEVDDFFLKDGIQLLIDGFNEEDLLEIMFRRTQVQKDRESSQISMAKNMGKYPPAFGMVGTLIGLVSLLEQIGGASGASKIGPSMAIALVTTLYGSVVANFIFIPIADNLQNRTYRTIVKRQIVIDGILLIKKGESPLMLQEKLNSYLPPANRKDFLNLGTREGGEQQAA